nr:uncharacterized protein LOC123276229 isoform X1 [Equus asinus]
MSFSRSSSGESCLPSCTESSQINGTDGCAYVFGMIHNSFRDMNYETGGCADIDFLTNMRALSRKDDSRPKLPLWSAGGALALQIQQRLKPAPAHPALRPALGKPKTVSHHRPPSCSVQTGVLQRTALLLALLLCTSLGKTALAATSGENGTFFRGQSSACSILNLLTCNMTLHEEESAL